MATTRCFQFEVCKLLRWIGWFRSLAPSVVEHVERLAYSWLVVSCGGWFLRCESTCHPKSGMLNDFNVTCDAYPTEQRPKPPGLAVDFHFMNWGCVYASRWLAISIYHPSRLDQKPLQYHGKSKFFLVKSSSNPFLSELSLLFCEPNPKSSSICPVLFNHNCCDEGLSKTPIAVATPEHEHYNLSFPWTTVISYTLW